MRRVVLVLCAVLLSAQSLHAVGTVTRTVDDVGVGPAIYTLAWTSNGSGAVSGNAFAVIKRGTIVQVKFVPGSGGTQPTDLYDVTLVDSDNVDVLGGLGANLSNSAGVVVASLEVIFDRSAPTLDLVVANAGASKTGTVIILVTH